MLKTVAVVLAVVMVVILLCCCSCGHQTKLAGRVGHVFFHKGGSGKTKLNVCKVRWDDYLFTFQQKELAASMKKILLFATLFLVMWLTFKPEAKGSWWRGSFWGNTWPRKKDAMPRPSIEFYFWLYALKLMNQDVSTAG